MRYDPPCSVRLTRYLALVAVVLTALAVPAFAKHPARPTNINQPVADGCQRATLQIGFDVSPEWVYINRSPTIRMARGVVHVSHNSVDDSILQHHSYDYNGNLVPDAPFRYLVAGSKSAHTQNFSGGRDDEEHARLHFEWEQGALPFFAWPADGDRATIWGSWIWDCGHFTTNSVNQGGTFTGEHSELHPLNAIVVNRRAPYLPSSRESETDAYVSNDGTLAHAVQQCALTHHPASSTQYDAGYRDCARDDANTPQQLARSYSFFVPAPSRPAGAGTLRFRAVKRVAARGVRERIRVVRNGLDVTVTPKRGARTVRYGKSFFVSWARDTGPRPTTLKITIKSLRVRQADPNPSLADPTPPPWTMYLNVNGHWTLLNNWAPKLYAVHDGQLIKINRTFTIHVPAGAPVWFQLSGRECDELNNTSRFGLTVGLERPCPTNNDEQNPNLLLLDANDALGVVLDVYRSAAAAVGSHTRTARARVHFPGTGDLVLGHGSQGNRGYVLKYAVGRG